VLNRREFVSGIGAAAIDEALPAIDVDNNQTIREILRLRIESEKRAVGMAVCVVAPRRQRYVTWGLERLGDDRPIASDTVFEIGSITKIFTALLLADMTRRGEVALEDPVSRHLPGDYHLPALDGRQIPLADLATHTSGLPRFPTLASASLSDWLEAVARFSVEDFKTWLAQFHPSRPAGSQWEYSNAGYALLGMALAYRSGRPYGTLLQTRLIDPMGLHDTAFHPTAAMRARVAESHDASLKPVPPMQLGIFAAAGALLSTPRDMARFATAIMPGSGASSPVDNQLLLTVQRAAPLIGGVQALGWELLDAPGGLFLNKDGVTVGQTASLVFDPDKPLAVVVFSNTFPDLHNSSPSGGGVGAADIARHLLRPQIPLGAG
jgi:D-alanyl-D-alanine-carboxypeptidase/D-alanyl-D-alanine-endopeptidase